MIRIGLLGASGKMGQWVTRLLATEYANRAELIASARQGDNLQPLLSADAIIDFSRPAAMVELARLALGPQPGSLPAMITGSTGWTAEQGKVLEELAGKTSVFVASNFSTGVFALHSILQEASSLLTRLGYTPVIVDTHHRHKQDSPSGTALWLQKAISPRNPAQVQTHSIRAGEVIGDHDVIFYGGADQVRLGHHAQDRSVFARGAIDVALWLGGLTAASRLRGRVLGMHDYFEAIRKN